MKISTVIKKEETIEKEITLPYFCKRNVFYQEFFKVVSEDTVLSVDKGTGGVFGINTYPLSTQEEKIVSATPCTEEEFTTAYSKALAAIDKAFMFPEPTIQEAKEKAFIDWWQSLVSETRSRLAIEHLNLDDASLATYEQVRFVYDKYVEGELQIINTEAINQ